MSADSPTFHVRAEVVADLSKDEVDVVLSRDGVGRHFGGCVCRPGDGHLLPGQEEDDTSVARSWIEQTHVVRTVGQKIQEEGFLLSQEHVEEEEVVEVAIVARVIALLLCLICNHLYSLW